MTEEAQVEHHEYVFPIMTDSSKFFRVMGAKVVRADLYGNGTLLSAVILDWEHPNIAELDAERPGGIAGMTDKRYPAQVVDFLGSRPFHAELGAKWKQPPSVKLYVEGNEIPTLSCGDAGNFGWKDATPSKDVDPSTLTHEEEVEVSCTSGRKKAMIVYTERYVGLRAHATDK